MSEEYTQNTEILETLSKLEHDQWMDWSKSIAEELENIVIAIDKANVDDESLSNISADIKKRLEKWSALWIDYNDLSEYMKDKDREYALKIINELKNKHDIEF